MGILARFKAAAAEFRHPGSGAGGGFGTSWVGLPGSRVDWSGAAGDTWKNSAAAIAMDWLANAMQQAPLAVYRETKDGREWLPSHPLANLLRRPNPFYGGRLLNGVTVLSMLSDGNAYWLRDKDARGVMTQRLRYVPHWMMEPRYALDGTQYIGSYDYSPGNGGTQTVPIEQVVHLRYGLDPENIRKGLSPLRAQLRQVASDNEVSTYMAAILRNMGIAGLLITSETELSEKAADDIKSRVRKLTTGDHRGDAIVMGDTAVTVSEFGSSPEKMALKVLADYPTARICAALHVDALVLGLSDKSGTYENVGQATKGAWEQGILPLMGSMCDDLNTQLGPEFLLPGEAIAFDVRTVKALQEDVSNLHDRARKNWATGIWKRSEARSVTGQAVTADDEVYITDVQTARALAVADRSAALQGAPVEPPSKALKGATYSPALIEGAKSAETDTATGDATPWADRIARELEALHAASA